MAHMNLSTKQKQAHDTEIRRVVAKEVRVGGEGWTGNLGLVDASYYV